MTDAPAKKCYSILKFTQDGNNYYYTDWNGDQTGWANACTVVTTLEVDLPSNTPGVDDQELEITFQAGEDSSGWLDGLTDGGRVAPVSLFMQIGLVPTGPGQTETEELIKVGYFRLVMATKNANEVRNKLRLSFRSIKSLLEVPLGIPATPRCAWAFGDKNCTVDASAVQETGTVASASRKTLTLTNPTDSAVVTSKPDDEYWLRGFIEYNGLRNAIRGWDGGGASPYEFTMVDDIPSDWVGKTVTLTPGCDKTPEICTSRWSNAEHFGGFGIAIPRHHPVFENPNGEA